MEERQPLQEYFRTLLMTVMGQALTAAGYKLEDTPQQWVGGSFQFKKIIESRYISYHTISGPRLHQQYVVS